MGHAHLCESSDLAIVGLDFRAFDANPDLQMIVERGLEVIGEAARSISDEFKKAHPEIPWKQIIGLRNIIAHRYSEIDHETIWRIAVEDLPALAQKLERLVPPSTAPDSQ